LAGPIGTSFGGGGPPEAAGAGCGSVPELVDDAAAAAAAEAPPWLPNDDDDDDDDDDAPAAARTPVSPLDATTATIGSGSSLDSPCATSFPCLSTPVSASTTGIPAIPRPDDLPLMIRLSLVITN
jgi:hypothetical protein